MAMNLTTEDYSRMPEPLKMEALSLAYVDAIAALAGANTYTPRFDLGADRLFAKVVEWDGGRRTDTPDMPIPLQVKASTRWEIREEHIVYDLEARTYNHLVRNKAFVLVLMCLPPNVDEWLLQDNHHLQLQKCCYYWRPPAGSIQTTNTETKRISIPERQIFTVDALTMLMTEERQR